MKISTQQEPSNKCCSKLIFVKKSQTALNASGTPNRCRINCIVIAIEN